MEKKKRIFNIFNMNRDGKGVSKDDVDGPLNFKNFFKNFGRKFSKLLSLNIMMWARLPMYILLVIIASWLLSDIQGSTASVFQIIFTTISSLFGDNYAISTSPLFGVSGGTELASGSFVDGSFIAGSPIAVAMNGIYGSVFNTPMPGFVFLVVLAIVLVFVLVTWGWQSAGAAYVLRGLVRHDPVFMLSDYFHAVKKNLRQGFFVGLIDALVIIVLTFDICYLYSISAGTINDILLFITSGMFIMYMIMRIYMYLLMITFDMSIRKILKNSLIFTVLGIKRNALAMVGCVLALVLNIILGIICMNISFIVPLILPLFYYMSSAGFTAVYAAYPVIDKYMIEPYRQEHPEEFPSDDESPDTETA